jgi:hypothetical protein
MPANQSASLGMCTTACTSLGAGYSCIAQQAAQQGMGACYGCIAHQAAQQGMGAGYGCIAHQAVQQGCVVSACSASCTTMGACFWLHCTTSYTALICAVFDCTASCTTMGACLWRLHCTTSCTARLCNLILHCIETALHHAQPWGMILAALHSMLHSLAVQSQTALHHAHPLVLASGSTTQQATQQGCAVSDCTASCTSLGACPRLLCSLLCNL